VLLLPQETDSSETDDEPSSGFEDLDLHRLMNEGFDGLGTRELLGGVSVVWSINLRGH